MAVIDTFFAAQPAPWAAAAGAVSDRADQHQVARSTFQCVGVDDETGEVVRRGGIDLVIKDGIVYDARRLLRDVEEMVAAAKAAEGG